MHGKCSSGIINIFVGNDVYDHISQIIKRLKDREVAGRTTDGRDMIPICQRAYAGNTIMGNDHQVCQKQVSVKISLPHRPILIRFIFKHTRFCNFP